MATSVICNAGCLSKGRVPHCGGPRPPGTDRSAVFIAQADVGFHQLQTQQAVLSRPAPIFHPR